LATWLFDERFSKVPKRIVYVVMQCDGLYNDRKEFVLGVTFDKEMAEQIIKRGNDINDPEVTHFYYYETTLYGPY
jgi:hypothetical protein